MELALVRKQGCHTLTQPPPPRDAAVTETRRTAAGHSATHLSARILWTFLTGGKKLKDGVAMSNLERMNYIAELAASGTLKPVIDRSYPLEQIAEAFTYVEQVTRREAS
jgi:NADPH:quinone reductase-like Zn-dependent oxidoreductase